MPGISTGAGLVPPLQLNLGSSASSDAKSGAFGGGTGVGALNEGSWIIQTTGVGNNGATATQTPASIDAAKAGNPLLLIALAVGALWLVKHK